MGHCTFSEKTHITRNLKCCIMNLFVHHKDKVSRESAVTRKQGYPVEWDTVGRLS